VADDRLPVRLYATNGMVSAGLNVLLAAALGHSLGWVWSVLLGVAVGLSLTWSYLRRRAEHEAARHPELPGAWRG
jgi:hypothetical protein